MADKKGADLTVCAFCRTPILPSANKTTVRGVSYHTGCWGRKAQASQRPTVAPIDTAIGALLVVGGSLVAFWWLVP
jgi:hypothetical protein